MMEIKEEDLKEVVECIAAHVRGGVEKDDEQAWCLRKFPWLAAGLAAAGVAGAAGEAIGSVADAAASAKSMRKSAGERDAERQIKNYLIHQRDPAYLSAELKHVVPEAVKAVEAEFARKKLVRDFRRMGVGK